jgi:hypothetical protein
VPTLIAVAVWLGASFVFALLIGMFLHLPERCDAAEEEAVTLWHAARRRRPETNSQHCTRGVTLQALAPNIPQSYPIRVCRARARQDRTKG